MIDKNISTGTSGTIPNKKIQKIDSMCGSYVLSITQGGYIPFPYGHVPYQDVQLALILQYAAKIFPNL